MLFHICRISAAVFGVLLVAEGVLAAVLSHHASRALQGPENVIGRADGPTSILVSSGFGPFFGLPAGMVLSFALFLASLLGVFFLRRKNLKK